MTILATSRKGAFLNPGLAALALLGAVALARNVEPPAELAWSPTLSGTYHVPERFGTLEFVE